MGHQPRPRLSEYGNLMPQPAPGSEEERWQKIYQRRRDVLAAVIAVVVLVVLVGIPLTILFEKQSEYDKFRAERTLIKICADGTRIYEWKGEPMLSDFTRVKREACQ